MTALIDLLGDYFALNTRIRSAETRAHYRRSIRQFAECLEHEPTTADLTDDNLRRFLLWTINTGWSEVTANQRAKQIRALWEWAARRRHVEQFPAFKMIEEPEPTPTAYMPGELPRLFAQCKKQSGYIGPIPADLWWLSQHWWFFATGERTEATLSLAREHVDLVNRVARVPAAIRKGKRKNMAYRLPGRLCELFEEMWRYPSRSGLVWERSFGIGAYYHRYHRLVAEAGLPTPRGKCGPQKLRITVLSMIDALGGDATRFAKHSSRQVTDESYIDQALVLAMQRGDWPPTDIDPERPRGGWIRRWLGRAG